MKVIVETRLVFLVPDGSTVAEVQRRFLEANRTAIGVPMQTVTGPLGAPGPGQPYMMLAIERLEVRPAP